MNCISYDGLKMEPQEVLAKVREILIQEFEISPSKVVPEATFMGTLGMDSLDVVDFVSFIEFAFEIDVGLKAYRDIDTVQKLVDSLVVAQKSREVIERRYPRSRSIASKRRKVATTRSMNG